MVRGGPPQTDSNAGERWGPRLWLALLAVVVVTACLTSYGINSWPMADDEVPSLVEMGLLPIDATTFSVPASQVGRLPRAVPVWYGLQGRLVRLLPQNQFGFRFSSVVFGIVKSTPFTMKKGPGADSPRLTASHSN